jgi:superfamily I DNA/RNA helicase/mRNA-degrading endonuclease RelE of RelBE toxin-antitoxin system
MLNEVLTTQDFDRVFQELQPQKQEIVKRKVKYLARDPSHPSLNAHRVKHADGPIWECYIDRGRSGMRLLYEIQGKSLLLWHLGGHDIIDRAHLLSFNRSLAQFFPWEHLAAEPPSPSAFPEQRNSVNVQGSAQTSSGHVQTTNSESLPQEINYFAYFRDAHLRMLGVPEERVQAVKEAETLEEVFKLPSLPDHARYRLLDLVTSPALNSVLFDSSQLLYRTRLDRLDGYFEGRMKKLMLNLEAEQQQYIDLDQVPLLLLKGTAGCGKTTIGIYRAIRLAEQGRRVLVVTFNSTLASATRTLIEELIGPLPANLEVKTFHQVVGSLLLSRFHLAKGEQKNQPRQFLREALREVRASETAQVLKRDETFFLEEIQGIIKGLGLISVGAYKAVKRYGRKTALGPVQREAVWKVYERYQRRMEAVGLHEWADAALLVLRQATEGPLGKIYDDIIVDEAQDLKPVDLRVIQLLIAPQGTQLILGDAAQTLYSRGFSWVQAGISARGRTSILRVNYRNTSQIAEAASQLIQNNTLMRASNEYVDPQWTRREGRLPVLLSASSSYWQIDLVRQEILKLIGEQVCRPSDIAILGSENEFCHLYKDILISNGLRAALHSDPDFNILEEQIKVMTIHSAKGLEFPVVFLMGLTEGNLPHLPHGDIQDEEEAQLEIERARMLCYVGMTRAADLLYLVTVRNRESRFIHELAGKILTDGA